MDLRNTLKTTIAPLHKLVEQNKTMKLYASGNSDLNSYQRCLRHIGSFWMKNVPMDGQLPLKYHSFYNEYLSNLTQDGSLKATSIEIKNKYQEYAFFYVFLGSGLGASIVIKNYKDTNLPFGHLHHLVENGATLWREFIPMLNEVQVKDIVLSDTVELFKNLIVHLETEEE